MIALLTGNNITRGQWPYRLQSTRAMENSSSNSGDLNSLGGLQTSSEVQFDLRFETSNLDYPGINVHIASNSHCDCLWGHGGLQMALEVTSDLGMELSDLNYLSYHASMASNCLQ